MNFTSSNSQSVLLIMSEEMIHDTSNCLSALLEPYKVSIIEANTALDGILAYNREMPCLVLIEDNLPDMFGCSLCAILKDASNGGDLVNVFLLGSPESYLANTKADFFFQKPAQFSMIGYVLDEFFKRRQMRLSIFSPDIERAKLKQKSDIPQKLESKYCFVTSIFSAFSELSGDGIDYWLADHPDSLYGFVFDCTGHDLLAYTQTSEMRSMLKMQFGLYLSGVAPTISKMLYNVNNVLFDIYNGDPIPTAAVLFHIQFSEGVLHYCSAGVPSFFVDYGTGYTPVMMRNPLIGSERNAEYDDHDLPLTDVRRLLFASDGLSELLFQKSLPVNFAKHDDVSGIAIEIKGNM